MNGGIRIFNAGIKMSSILNTVSSLFIPIIIIGVIAYGIYKKAPVYDYFTAGAKEGLKTCVEMLPFIIAIFIGIEAITSSGAMEFFQKIIGPFMELIGIPRELTSIIILRPVSGSGSVVLAERLMRTYGTDSLVGTSASVMVGSCETVFYVLALYYGVTSVKKLRHALPAGIIGYIAGVLASVYISYIMLIS